MIFAAASTTPGSPVAQAAEIATFKTLLDTTSSELNLTFANPAISPADKKAAADAAVTKVSDQFKLLSPRLSGTVKTTAAQMFGNFTSQVMKLTSVATGAAAGTITPIVVPPPPPTPGPPVVGPATASILPPLPSVSFLEEYKTPLLIGLGAIVLGAVGYSAYMKNKR